MRKIYILVLFLVSLDVLAICPYCNDIPGGYATSCNGANMSLELSSSQIGPNEYAGNRGLFLKYCQNTIVWGTTLPSTYSRCTTTVILEKGTMSGSVFVVNQVVSSEYITSSSSFLCGILRGLVSNSTYRVKVTSSAYATPNTCSTGTCSFESAVYFCTNNVTSGDAQVSQTIPGTLSISWTGETFEQIQWCKVTSSGIIDIAGANNATYTPTESGIYVARAVLTSGTSCCPTGGLSNTYSFCFTSITISNLKDLYCPSDDAVALIGTPPGGVFSWTGKPPNTSIFDPATAGTGVKEITYSFPNDVNLTCEVKKKTMVLPPTGIVDSVLSASAVRLSDNWPVDEKSVVGLPAHAQLGSFPASYKGVWRGEESYTYVTERQQSQTLNIKVDGIFNGFEVFNHDNGAMEECYYKWRKVNTITHYDNNSNETENKDILNIYSSALFGYNGDLAIAVAGNSDNQEMGYNSFEELPLGTTVDPTASHTGNLVFSSSASVANQYLMVDYTVGYAVDNVLTVNASPQQLAPLLNQEIRAFGSYLDSYSRNTVHGIYKVAAISAHSDPAKSLVTLNSTDVSGIWKGRITNQLQRATPLFSPGTSMEIVNTKKHSGAQSLKISGTVVAEQYKLNLQGSSYVVSAWVNADVAATGGYTSGSRGIKVQFINAAGASTYSSLLAPTGFVIENWQRIEGTVQIPVGTVRVALVLQSGSAPSWWDDIRLFPADGNIKTFVYNKKDYTLNAELDANNYATFYYYSPSGGLQLIKKETERGVVTLQESKTHIAEPIIVE